MTPECTIIHLIFHNSLGGGGACPQLPLNGHPFGPGSFFEAGEVQYWLSALSAGLTLTLRQPPFHVSISLTFCQHCPNVGPVPLAQDNNDTALAVIAGLLLVLRLQRWPNNKLTFTTHKNYIQANEVHIINDCIDHKNH